MVLALLVLSSFVFAVGSEINTDFVVNMPKKEVANYVSHGSSFSNYFGFMIVGVLTLVFVYFMLKTKKDSKKIKRVSKKKSSKRVK